MKYQFSVKKGWVLAVLVLLGTLLSFLGVALSAEQVIRSRATEEGSLLKIGFTTDWEYGSRTRLNHKLTNKAPELLQEVVRHFNEESKPDIIVGGGDYIEGSNVREATALRQLQDIVAIFQTVQAPVLYTVGNHDMRSLTKDQVKEILGIEEAHSFRDIGDWRIVVLDTNFNFDETDRAKKNYVTGYVSKAELQWLDRVLATDRPTVIFSHHSIYFTQDDGGDGTHLTNNIMNSAEVRAVLESHPNVLAAFAGHTPRAQHAEYNGIHYFVTDTLVHDLALGAFSDIELRYNSFSSKAEISFHQYGLQEETYTVVSWMRRDIQENNRYMLYQYLAERNPFKK